MPQFRYYCLYENGKIASGEHIDVAGLAAAIRLAYDDCHARSKGHCCIEVWCGTEMLYSTPRGHETRDTVTDASDS
jgi:hypothetical protein